jgi:hypothetical protein
LIISSRDASAFLDCKESPEFGTKASRRRRNIDQSKRKKPLKTANFFGGMLFA